MKINKVSIRKTDIIPVVVLIIFLWVLLNAYRSSIIHPDLQDLRIIKNWLGIYIWQNDGGFPVSEEDMIEKGLLRKSSATSNGNYSLRASITDAWFEGVGIDKFNINYGFEYENVDLIDNKLFDKDHGGQVLLIDCLNVKEKWKRKKLKNACENVTNELYQKMIRRKKRAR